MRYDVIVVGSGPAGSTAARECASRGMSVLLLDRAEFPRDKPCGGGVNIRAARLLPFDLEAVAERTIVGMRISVKQAHAFDKVALEPLTILTQRTRFDALLVEKAVASGATLRERASVREVEHERGHVTVRVTGATFEGCTLVAADGANGVAAKASGMRIERDLGIAIEGNITPHVYPDRWIDMFGIDVGSIPGGYGWLFPKGDHVNVGVGGRYDIGPSLRPRLDLITRFYGFNPDSLWGVRGHPLPVRRAGAALVHGNVLAVGDAAGLLDPLSGEGIYAALWSGRSAARNLASYLDGQAPTLDGYGQDVETALVPDLRTSTQLRDLFHVSPRTWAYLVQHSSRAWTLLCGLLTGDATYAGVRSRSRILSAGIDIGSSAIQAANRIASPYAAH